MPGCLLRAPGFFIEMDPAAQPQPFVEFRDVRFGYGERAILDGVSFSLPRGKVTALMGASGGGKTTVLRLIGGQQRGGYQRAVPVMLLPAGLNRRAH